MQVRQLPSRFVKIQCSTRWGIGTHETILDTYTGKVYHFDGQNKLQASVIEETWESFASRSTNIKAVPYVTPFSDEEIAEHIRKGLGKGNYNLLLNNCQHFVSECLSGVRQSFQVAHVGVALFFVGVGLLIHSELKPR